MKIFVLRHLALTSGTYGTLFIHYANDNSLMFTCATLEPVTPQIFANSNSFKACCITAGSYKGKLMFSPGLNCGVLVITGVEGRSGIEFNVGNTIADTLGSILIGQSGRSGLINSMLTFKLFNAIVDVEEPIEVIVTNLFE